GFSGAGPPVFVAGQCREAVHVLFGRDDHTPPIAAVAAVGSPARCFELVAETHAAVAAVPAFDINRDAVEEHENPAGPGPVAIVESGLNTKRSVIRTCWQLAVRQRAARFILVVSGSRAAVEPTRQLAVCQWRGRGACRSICRDA